MGDVSAFVFQTDVFPATFEEHCTVSIVRETIVRRLRLFRWSYLVELLTLSLRSSISETRSDGGFNVNSSIRKINFWFSPQARFAGIIFEETAVCLPLTPSFCLQKRFISVTRNRKDVLRRFPARALNPPPFCFRRRLIGIPQEQRWKETRNQLLLLKGICARLRQAGVNCRSFFSRGKTLAKPKEQLIHLLFWLLYFFIYYE